MKIAVYAICKNEIANVDAFMASTEGADSVVVMDTGSTDGTPDRLKEKGASVIVEEVRPWRFDRARNVSLDRVPSDIDWCISLDLDERMMPGWRKGIEKAASKEATRMQYPYTWSWKSKGVPDLQYLGDKIHRRHGYKWHHPAHECLRWSGSGDEKSVHADILIEHHQLSVNYGNVYRGNCLALLEMARDEDPDCDRNAHYLAREYYFTGSYQKAIDEFQRHLSLKRAVWKPERAASYRYMSPCYMKLGNRPEAKASLMRACAEAPNYREPWLELAMFCYNQQDHIGVFFACERGLSIKERELTYLTLSEAWGERLHDLASIACYNLGMKKQAKEHLIEAIKINPKDIRLLKNMEFMK